MKRRVCFALGSFPLSRILLAIMLVLIGKVDAQDVPPTDCPPTRQIACCPPQVTNNQRSWPPNVTVNVNIDPSFLQPQRDAIAQAFQNWQAAGQLDKNGSGIHFTITYNSTPPSMNPPPGTYNVQVWHQDPPRNPGLGGDNAVTIGGNSRVAAQEIWINTQTTDACAASQTAAHEIGHGFGLDEATGCAENSSVMNAGTNGYNGTTGTYGPTTCDDSKVNQTGQYPTPTPTPTPCAHSGDVCGVCCQEEGIHCSAYSATCVQNYNDGCDPSERRLVSFQWWRYAKLSMLVWW